MTSQRMSRFEERMKGASVAPTQEDVNRDAIATRCPDLERLCPDAVEVATESSAALHGSINGRATDLAGNRPPKYFRRQLRGEEALTGEDIARLAIQAPADLVAWLAPILAAVAHGAPLELLQALHATSSIVDERVLQMREQLGGVDEVARRVAAHRAAKGGGR